MRLLVVVGFLVTSSVSAQERIAISSLADVDEDFAFQGEYSGLILPDTPQRCQRFSKLGLQVIARGGGTFEAVAFDGGLPGAGARGERQMLKGRREGGVLKLDGEQLQVVIEDRRATLRSAAGHVLGSFVHKVRRSPTLGARPPRNAIVLFDGSNTDEFKNGRMTEDGLLQEGTEFKRTFRDFTLHLEFQLAYMPNSQGQKRSNSGVYLQSRYELQVLDSFGLEGVENECGAMYRYQRPDVNMCFPPLSWQTYDINFRAPRFDDAGEKIENARITVRHNGVLIHNGFALERKTGAGQKEGPNALPIKLQNHRDPVRFRNIWVVDHAAPSQRMVCPPQIGLLPSPSRTLADVRGSAGLAAQ